MGTYFNTYVLCELIKIHLRFLLTVKVLSIPTLSAVHTPQSTSTLHHFRLCSLVFGLKLLVKFFKSFKTFKHFKIRSICFRV